MRRAAVDDRDATRYEIVTDLKAAVAGAKADEKAACEALVGAGISEIKQTVWLDADDLPVKANSTAPALNVAGQQIPESTMTVR
ncbi:hypothetical protein ACWDKQ_30135 [Saccharopolyspora sp. NPDC000995]